MSQISVTGSTMSDRTMSVYTFTIVRALTPSQDIGWTFSDEDALERGIKGSEHRRFLNAFFVNRHPNSFARGVPFQDNPRTGDCRISGTAASLAGIEAEGEFAIKRILLLQSLAFSTGGIPLLYLGDEVRQNVHGEAGSDCSPHPGRPTERLQHAHQSEQVQGLSMGAQTRLPTGAL